MMVGPLAQPIISENFDDPLGPEWTNGGAWTVQNGYVVTDSTVTRQTLLHSVDVGHNYVVQCKVYVESSPSSRPEGQAAVMAVDHNNLIFAGLNAWGWEGGVGDYMAGSSTQLAGGGQSNYQGIELGKWYNLKVSVNKGLIKVYVNGVLLAEHQEPEMVGPERVGLTCMWSIVRFDDFKVWIK
jgi:hypothetical protein